MSPPSRPLHILMTTDAVGGVWTYTTALAQQLCAGGDRVSLVTLGPEPDADQLAPLRGIAGLDVEITDLALEWMDPEGQDFARARRRLAQIARCVRPDLVHLNGFREATGEWDRPVLVVAHSDVRSWWRACRGGDPDEGRWRIYAENVAAGLRAADAWAVPTRSYCDTVEALYAPPTSGCVVRNGIDIRVTGMAKQPYVLAAGRLWDEAKNLAALCAVASLLEWPVRVAGNVRACDGAQSVSAADTVDCLGPLTHADLLARMRSAAIFAAPALYEPFGLGVLEAAAAGCALLLSDVASFRELWDGAALFVNPHDRAALAAALQRLCHDAPLRAHFQRAARRRARRYALPDAVAQYRDVYRTIVRRAPPAISVSSAELCA